MFESLVLTPFPLAIIAYLNSAYRAEQDFRNAVARALIRNRECGQAYVSGYVAGFALGKRSGEAAGRRREETPPPAAIRNPVTLIFWGRDSAVTVSRPDIFHIEQETHLSPMMVYLRSRGTERPLACAPCDALRKINHTLRLDRWINTQRPDADDIDF